MRTVEKYVPAVRKYCPKVKGIVIIDSPIESTWTELDWEKVEEEDKKIEANVREEKEKGMRNDDKIHDSLPKVIEEMKLLKDAKPKIDVSTLKEAIEYWSAILHHVHVPRHDW